jgi:hypothetical protein
MKDALSAEYRKLAHGYEELQACAAERNKVLSAEIKRPKTSSPGRALSDESACRSTP